MKLLVFGQTGQVARALQLLVPEARFLARAYADLSDPAACAAAIGAFDADAVINAAAWTAVDKAEGEEAAASVINGAAPAAMATAAADRGLPFLHISTDYVFDGQGSRAFAPDDPTAPLGAYGRSKLLGEQGVRAAGGTVLRTSWVFSADGANFVRTMLRLGAARDAVSVVADQTGGPTPAAAIAAALVTMAGGLRDGAPAGTYHFSGAPDVTWAGFARAIFATAGMATEVREITTADYPTPARRPANSRLDCSATAATFGIARPDWQAGLQAVLQDLKDTP